MDIGDIYLITGTDFDNGSINFKTSKYVSEFRYKQDKNIQLQNDDILITKDGTLGKVAIIRNLNKRATLNSGIYRIRINDITKVDPNYLYQYLSAPFLLNFANKTSIGGTIKHLNQSQIVNLPIPLSTLEEQKKISKFLFNLELKIKIVNGKINILKKYKEGLVLKALKPTIENWKSDTVKGIRLSSFLVPYKKLGATKNYIHATLSREGISDKTERYNRDFLVKDENKKYRITDEGDLVYNPANLKFGVICINHYGICVVSPIYETFKVRNIDRDLLESIVTSKSFIRYALKFEEGTVYERRSVSVEDLLKIKVCLEDINQEKFVNILKTITDRLMLLSSMKEHCENLKQFLLRNMFI